MLSELRCGSSCASSTSNPGARRTNSADRNAPSNTVASRTSPFRAIWPEICRAIFRPRMVHLLGGGRPERSLFLLACECFGVVDLFHRVHASIGFGQQTFDV